ncbi:GntR family transcriptional regulator [Sphingomonas sp.]|uniref:GntR family transcriptional regulator n=1 Tax=Sphingomonas sp. TaxID=28214 RepID=UPI0031D2ACA8
MNAAGPTAERIYEALKASVLRGVFRPGARLDPAVLAEQLDSSVTPVRASLNVLVGEGLVETGTGEGFHMPLIDEPALKDRYAWNAEILGIVLRRSSAGVRSGSSIGEPSDAAAHAAGLFLHIARWSSNLEHARAIALMNDRLHAVRVAETGVLRDITAELGEIAGVAKRRETAALRTLIARYHLRRYRSAAAILRQLYRMDGNPAAE